jgi:hypothetical protein
MTQKVILGTVCHGLASSSRIQSFLKIGHVGSEYKKGIQSGLQTRTVTAWWSYTAFSLVRKGSGKNAKLSQNLIQYSSTKTRRSGGITPNCLNLGTTWSVQLHGPAAWSQTSLLRSLGRRLWGAGGSPQEFKEAEVFAPAGSRILLASRPKYSTLTIEKERKTQHIFHKMS